MERPPKGRNFFMDIAPSIQIKLLFYSYNRNICNFRFVSILSSLLRDIVFFLRKI